ncbi:hypothetical protein ABIB56_001372 [Glaciihabitans sp. UYNi722]
MIQNVTRWTRRDASALVRASEVVGESQATGDAKASWLGEVGDAVLRGDIELAAVDAIRNGLGLPGDEISAAALRDAAHVLVARAEILDADKLFAEARVLRGELDAAGIADREAERRGRRTCD